MPAFSNAQVAQLLNSVAAAYQIKGLGNQFQIRAYENAATGVEHATESVQALSASGQLDQIPGVGERIAGYLDELFKTGRVKHFEQVLRGIPESALTFLNIPGVGPKTAYKLAVEAKIDSVTALKHQIKSGQLAKQGFSDKLIANLARGINQMEGLSKRLLLPQALITAESLITGLKKDPSVLEAYPLGSIRRMAATVGDIDLGVASSDPQQTIKTFVNLPQVSQITDQGEIKASVVLKNGLQVDLLTGSPATFGSLLQHFTGSKAHNIHLRELALRKGLSLSENGIKEVKTGKTIVCPEENDLYRKLEMQTPPPELREDTGEIEAALAHKLPGLVELSDIRGDLQAHSTYSDGQNSVKEMADAAQELGYSYLALTDHSYPNTDFDKRIKEIEKYNYSNKGFRVIKGLEINITADGGLQVPDVIMSKHEFNIASIHSGFNQSKEQLTERMLFAIKHPFIDMIGHPTGRLIGERGGYELDWEKVFRAASKYHKVLEIDGYPDRSDLPDPLIREAVKRNIKLAIDTDAHATTQLSLMKFGVALARRGWVTPDLVINTWSLEKLLASLKHPKIK